MQQKLAFPFCTNFTYTPANRSLTLTSLMGLSCSFNGYEDDYSNSGLAVVCVDTLRCEGRKLKYTLIEATENIFRFDICDENDLFKLECCWTFETQFHLISCCCTLVNLSDKPFSLRRALPRFVFAPGKYRLHYQESRWLSENQPRCTELAGMNIKLSAGAARSTVGNTPFCILEDIENSSAAAFHLVPRGNWNINIRSSIIKSEAPMPIVEPGLADTDLFFSVAPQERIELPQVIITEVPDCDPGLSGAYIQQYMIDRRIPDFLHTPPVLYNTWLYRFTDLKIDELRAQLKAAKELGCEVFVVDAGWFGNADWWNSVGDWQEREGEPFFGNMASFAEEVRSSGLDFGFWMEPERWEVNASIRKKHPEWFPAHSTRIDLTQPSAAEHFRKTIADNVRKFKARYIKIDFNAAAGYDESGKELYDYCSKFKELILELRKEFPELVIENCGAGALRNDLDTATYFDAAFVSDHAHLYENLKIRQGAFMRTLPGRTLNWAVTRPAPERLTKVSDELLVMAGTSSSWDEGALFNVNFVMSSALLGIPGFTGDIAGLPQEVRDVYAKYVAFYKENRKLFLNSHVYQLNFRYLPMSDNENILAFQMQEHAGDNSLIFVFTSGLTRRDRRRFKLQNLDPEKNYSVKKLFCTEEVQETSISGRELMKYGIDCELQTAMHIRHRAAIYQVSSH